jgi:hypothetical protein
VLRDEPALGQRLGPPRDLTGVATIVGYVRRWSDGQTVASSVATIIGPATDGTVSMPIDSMVPGSPGLHLVEWVVNGSDRRTYPRDPLRPEWLMVAQPLTSVGAASLPNPGAPLFAIDGTTPIISANGQILFVGAGATITVSPTVSWFQVGWYPGQTPWSAATVPTITQGGTTTAAGLAAELLASGGNLVVITRVYGEWVGVATGRAPIWAYNGTGYAPDPDARLIEVGTGDPAPTGLLDNDITLQINP